MADSEREYTSVGEIVNDNIGVYGLEALTDRVRAELEMGHEKAFDLVLDSVRRGHIQKNPEGKYEPVN